ncbi:hypothetical protein PMSD_19680 [Paenibacillus macquariensis subsp. defensor]|nr:hypothetical protein PMSD_19680 [Paenibacillus macquariensis subsp. defensor]
MKRKAIGIMVALLGSGGILLSGIGERGNVKGWEPLNLQVAQALGEGESPSSKKQGVQEASTSNVLDSAADSKSSEIRVNENSVNSTPLDNKSGTSIVEQKVDQVETNEQTIPKPTDTASSDAANIHKINVNTGGIKELMELPGIGEKKAKAIVDYRNQNGPFRKISDLNDVKGIGTKMMAKIAPYVEL